MPSLAATVHLPKGLEIPPLCGLRGKFRVVSSVMPTARKAPSPALSPDSRGITSTGMKMNKKSLAYLV